MTIMEPVKIHEILKWTEGRVEGHAAKNLVFKSVSVDSRSVKKGDLFIALKGENFNGHDFVQDAFSKGAAACVVENGFFESGDKCLISVKDTVKSLGNIARGYRKQFSAKVIGVTGSCGKTTTKEIIREVLASKYRVHANYVNNNNEIGVPLTLLGLNKTHEFCIVEMGMNKKGEIDYLSNLSLPSIGVITNVGAAHMGFFANIQEIAEAKSELLGNLKKEKTSILNYDSKFFNYLKTVSPGRVTSFGFKKGADFQAVIDNVGKDSFSFHVKPYAEQFSMNFWNPLWVYSGVIGIIFSKMFSIPIGTVREVLSDFSPVDKRGNVLKLNRITVIDETYNSNPDSLKWALYYLSKRKGRKTAIIGDMAELGRYSFLFHYNIGRYLSKLPVDRVLLLGQYSSAIRAGIKDSKRVKQFSDIDGLKIFLRRNVSKGDTLLVKGSRIVRMERIVEFLKNKFS